ncbi:V-type ATP synthase subunit I [Jeotgalibaca sp. A122]|uniref:V-type ATP synthase subunit I n=1 Tax=Jeotgalibaca sp. A122 TaxID=3457322 RepID=UPI003FD30D78
MAIAKMSKLKLISFQDHKEAILKELQSLQSVELIDMSAEYAEVQAMSSGRREQLEIQSKTLEDKYNQYRDQLNFLIQYLPQPKLLQKLRTPKQALSLQELEEGVAAINQHEVLEKIEGSRKLLRENEQALGNLLEEEAFLSKWEKLNYVPFESHNLKHLTMLTGTVPQSDSDSFIRTIRDSGLFYIEEIFQTRDEYGISIVYDHTDENEARKNLDENHFSPLDYPFSQIPELELKRVAGDREKLLQENKAVKEQLKTMRNEEQALQLMIEDAYAELQRVRGQQLIVDERHLFVLEGWLEESKLADMRDILEQRLESADYAIIVDDVQEEEISRVPIVLKNSKFVAPFENITAMYSLPKYNEMDPTPFLMPFYLLFFGMMMADAGYGLLMFLATGAALKFFHMNKAMNKNILFFHLLSYPTIIWGLIYGSFFGLELPFMLLSTMDDVNTILLLSVVFGVVQILLGLGLKAYLLFRDKDVLGAISDGVGWIVIFVGLIVLIIASMVFPNAFLATIGQGIAIAGVIAILLATTLASKNKGLGFGLGLYNLYGITGYVGDIVSYTRLMALGVSGSSIALAFNMIIDFLPTPARFTVGILLFIVLHLINIGLSLLSAYVHGARLIFVEFFGKFYEGGGKALDPLRTSEEYIELKNNYNG